MPVPLALAERWPALQTCPEGLRWLKIQRDLQLAPRTVDAYAGGLADYLRLCQRRGWKPTVAGRAEIAAYVRELAQRPARDPCAGHLANATIQQRLVAVRLFYDHLVEEGLCETNPVGRGRHTPRRGFGTTNERGLVPRLSKLPWIPSDEQWRQFLTAAAKEPIRNRLMLALAYDAALRREELCALRTEDLDPAHRTIRVRAETTKNRRERIVPYSIVSGGLLTLYLQERRELSAARGPLFLSTSDRNRAQAITAWTWSKVVRSIGMRAGLARFGTHTFRHLCLTDLARAGWELHAIATFAGHRSTSTTLLYIHLSGRDLAKKLSSALSEIHTWRLSHLNEVLGE